MDMEHEEVNDLEIFDSDEEELALLVMEGNEPNLNDLEDWLTELS